jgi:hypothetical protein
MRGDSTIGYSGTPLAMKLGIEEGTIREVLQPLGFVDIKLCAVTEVWSGLKLVVRKKRR